MIEFHRKIKKYIIKERIKMLKESFFFFTFLLINQASYKVLLIFHIFYFFFNLSLFFSFKFYVA